MNHTNDFTDLLDRYIVQMTGREFYSLIREANASGNASVEAPKLCMGIHALAEHLGCCESTIYMLRREGVLDDAIKSQIGKKIVFDVNIARDAANNYLKARRRKTNE